MTKHIPNNNSANRHRVKEKELVRINKAREKVGLKPREQEKTYKDYLKNYEKIS
jgi:hypothetical protein